MRGWWSGDIDGPTDRLGGEFTYRYEDMHRSTQRITELEPGRKIVWQVIDAELSFIADKAEWTGTSIIFDIARPASGRQSPSLMSASSPTASASTIAPAPGAFTSTAASRVS